MDRLKLVYADETAAAGRIECLDDAGQTMRTLDMSDMLQAIPCLASGTRIATRTGMRPVEDLRPGDMVLTRDHGQQPVIWAGSHALTWRDLGANPILRPVRMRAGAFGNGVPDADLVVSPNHQMLVTGRAGASGKGTEALIMARHLVGRPGIEVLNVMSVTYHQVLFSRHELILAEGLWTESYRPDASGLGAMNAAVREKVLGAGSDMPSMPVGAYDPARDTVARHNVISLIV
ncbi:MAG: Hint domain-containing protein [Rhodobacteraceae bacterium]|nr:Hint domain-containing protein [Paracoccaceae bacterium]